MKKKTPYLTSQQIYDEWLIWKEYGNVTEKMGEYMLMLAKNVVKMKYFNRYPQWMKDDIVQDGVVKIMANLKNMKAEKKSGFFSYWTHCVFTAGIVYLAKHYKYVNRKRQMILERIEQMQMDNQNLPRYLSELAEELKLQIDKYDFDRNENDETED